MELRKTVEECAKPEPGSFERDASTPQATTRNHHTAITPSGFDRGVIECNP